MEQTSLGDPTTTSTKRYGINAPERDQPFGKKARKVVKQYMPLDATESVDTDGAGNYADLDEH